MPKSKNGPTNMEVDRINKKSKTNHSKSLTSNTRKRKMSIENESSSSSSSSAVNNDTNPQYQKGIFYPDRIINKKTNADGEDFFLIKWKGESSKEATWEPAGNFTKDAMLMSTLKSVKTDDDILNGLGFTNLLATAQGHAWIYVRVSSEEQSKCVDGHKSLEDQETLCTNYCVKQNLEIQGVISEVGSARDMTKLRQLNNLLESVDSGDIIVCLTPDRFSRNAGQAILSMGRLSILGVNVLFVNEEINYMNVTHRYHIHNLFVASQQVTDAISLKIRTSIKQRRIRGEHVGSIPYGFKLVRNSSNLLTREPDIDLLTYVRSLRDQPTIVLYNNMKKNGVTINKKPATHSSVKRLITNINKYSELYNAYINKGKAPSTTTAKKARNTPKKVASVLRDM